MAVERSRQFKGYTLKVDESGVHALHRGAEIGHLFAPEGVIESVAVQPKHQEKGLASAMLQFGRQHRPIAHDIESNMTASGYGWAKANP